MRMMKMFLKHLLESEFGFLILHKRLNGDDMKLFR